MAARKKAKSRTAPASPSPPMTAIKIQLEMHGDPVYANYAEVSASQHEFQITFALTPLRPSAEVIEQAKTGVLKVESLVQILLPPTLIPGLITALTTTKEQHEALVGPIKEIGVPNA